jgi:DNA adenine methylase
MSSVSGHGFVIDDVAIDRPPSMDHPVIPTPIVQRSIARPVVKWAGGKTRLLSELTKRIPSTYGDYHEPFAGGAALFFSCLGLDDPSSSSRSTTRSWFLSDMNHDLVAAYRAIVDDPEGVHGALFVHQMRHDEAYYYATRSLWNDTTARCAWPACQVAACFLYLNRAGYNGLWRVNLKGDFNVPIGRSSSGRDPSFHSLEDLTVASDSLRQATITCQDFRNATGMAKPGDFVYLDSPYVPVSITSSFSTYNPGGFNESDHVDLARCFRDMARRGVSVMLSNSDTAFTRSLYKDFLVETVTAPRSINSRGGGRGPIGEILVTWGCAVAR